MIKNIQNFFVKLFNKTSESLIPKNDIQKQELDITHQLFYGQFEKLTTKESIFLYQKISDNFLKEIDNREISAKYELEIISKFKNK